MATKFVSTVVLVFEMLKSIFLDVKLNKDLILGLNLKFHKEKRKDHEMTNMFRSQNLYDSNLMLHVS